MSVYDCSDFYGYYSIYEKINSKLKPEDKVVFLGDAGDRGPHSLKTILAILDNPQWIYLKGNHEDMLVNAMRYGPVSDTAFLSRYNGGGQTMEDLQNHPNCKEIIKRLNDLPLYYFYHSKDNGLDFHCTHAGFTPKENTLNVFEQAGEHDLIWDREHLHDWGYYYLPELYFNAYILHGHTPVENMTEYYDIEGHWMGEKLHSPYIYSQNNKINIDAGTYYTHEAYLFNLDDFSFETIKADEGEVNGEDDEETN